VAQRDARLVWLLLTAALLLIHVPSIGFVGDEHFPSSGEAVETTPTSEVGDATITDLIQLRGVEGWRDLFLPEGTRDDHPGRVKVDLVKKVGLR
jgi:hypothetical protein